MPERWQTSSNAPSSASAPAPRGFAEKRSTCRLPAGQARHGLLDRAQQPLGPTAVDERVGLRPPQHGGEIQHPELVLRMDRDAVAVGRELVDEGHRGALPAAVQELPVGARGLRLLDHRDERRDADAAGDELVARRGDQGEVVARPPDPHRRALELARARTRTRRGSRGRAARRPATRARSAALPHSEYWRVSWSERTRSMCAPGVQAGSVPPSGSVSSSVTTSSATGSLAAMTRSASCSLRTVLVRWLTSPSGLTDPPCAKLSAALEGRGWIHYTPAGGRRAGTPDPEPGKGAHAACSRRSSGRPTAPRPRRAPT